MNNLTKTSTRPHNVQSSAFQHLYADTTETPVSDFRLEYERLMAEKIAGHLLESQCRTILADKFPDLFKA